MPVNLKLIPPPAARPRPPLWWVWLLLLAGMLLTGIVYTILNNMEKTKVDEEAFWVSALGLPSLFWLVLLGIRMALYQSLLAVAESKDVGRESTLHREIQRGQRFLHIYGMSLFSALREPEDASGRKQWDALLKKSPALKTQASWKSDDGVRHSQLIRLPGESSEQLLNRAMTHILEVLSPILASIPDETSLAFLLESQSRLPQDRVESIWQQAWMACGNKHSLKPVPGSGLSAIDQWLDNQSNKQSWLLIVAVNIEPEHIEGNAECIVGLLLGGSDVRSELMPLARLHRPEQAHHTSVEDLHYAMRQSLTWVPVAANDVTNGWLIGVNPTWHIAIATGLEAICSPINIGKDLCDIGSILGYPGPAAPWLVIASAAEMANRGKEQLVICGNNHEDIPLWVTQVTPAENKKAVEILQQ